MFLTRKHLSRRTVLKGAGASIALPLLDAMIPAGTAWAQTAAAPATRLGFIYFPHGALRNEWEPPTTGRNPKFPFILEPLEPVRDYVTVVSGLRNKAGEGGVPARHHARDVAELHAPAAAQRRNGRRRHGRPDRGATSQKDTTLPSMEICGEPGGMISFRSPTQPLPMEGNPRKVFISMFGQGQTKEERQAILGTTTSLLDYVTEATASLNRKLDAADRAKVDNYLSSVREVEQRVQKLAESSESLSDLPDAPIGAPDDFGELLAVQFELFALAWETNRTNVVTMKMVEEASMRVYANLGVHDAFHPTSHWGGFPERIANLRKIQNYHTSLFAKFAQRLANTPDGDGSLLDHSIILFGSNMGNSDAHDADLLPEALIGRGGGLKGNQHLHYERNTPLANLLVTMLDRAGVPAEELEKFGDSTGPFSEV